MAAIYAAFFVSAGIYLPFIPVWLESRGFDVGEIAFVLAAPLVIRTFLSPWLTFAIDGYMSRKTALVAINVFMVAVIGLLSASASFPVVVSLFVIMGLCSGATLPLTDASALRVARLQGFDYGRIRLWGSISFLLTTVAGGTAIGWLGIEVVLLVIALAHGVLAVIAALAPIPARTDTPDALAASLPPGPSALHVLSRPAFVSVLAIAALLQASHGVNYAFASLHWQRLGYSPFLIGMLWATGVMAEILLFAWSKTLLESTGPRRLLLLAAAGAVLRWTLLAFDPPLPVAFFAQSLHCMTFGLTYLAALTFISRTVKAELNATAQSLQYGLSGALTALATLAAGYLFNAFAAKAYLAMAAIAVAALIGLAIIRRVVPEVEDSAP